jgi:hypothetical protein
MKLPRSQGDIEVMSVAVQNRMVCRGPGLLIAHCAAIDSEERLPVTDRLHVLIGPDLTRLLVVALAGDHRMGTRRVAA